MSKPSFVYVTYINSSPEQVWNALQDPEMTTQYWFGHTNASNWEEGSGWEHRRGDTVRLAGTVLEVDPPRRLVLSWAAPEDTENPEKVSRVTFEIEPTGDSTRLTVLHEELDDEMMKGISKGWPAVLSNLKTLLETGQTLAMAAKQCGDE